MAVSALPVAVTRTPVAIATEHGMTILVCDDGTTWERRNGKWVQTGPPVPGSRADTNGEHTK